MTMTFSAARLGTLAATLLSLTAVACGGDPSTIETEADAAKISAGAGALTGLTSVSADGTTEACPGGGEVAVSTDSSSGVGSGSSTQTLELSACVVDGITYSGSLESKTELSLSLDVTSTLKGEVTVSGDVTGVCKFDTKVKSGLEDAFTGGELTIEGTVCGFDAQELSAAATATDSTFEESSDGRDPSE